MKTFFFDKSLLVSRYYFYSEIKEFLKSSFDGFFFISFDGNFIG